MLKNQIIKFKSYNKFIQNFNLNNSNLDVNKVIFHLVISIILFLPIFFGRFQMAGTDQYFNIFPNIIYGFREFKEFGSFSLWNPYIFSGLDMSESIHSHFLHPVLWPALFFDEKYFFHVITFIFFLFNFGLAIFLD